MQPIVPRFEYRVWAQDLDEVGGRLRSMAEPGATRESTETYLLSAATAEVNVKVRDDLLDVKTLGSVVDGFEQWSPEDKLSFPVSAVWLREVLFPLWEVDPPAVVRVDYSLGTLIREIVEPHGALAAVGVRKRRQALSIDGCIAELADVIVGDYPYQTAAIESVDLEALRKAVFAAGLVALGNTSYPRMIRGLLGWTTV